MTQVDFYIIDSDAADARLMLACKIVEKAYRDKQHVFIHSSSEAEARKLDELLWTFSQSSFIPHRVVQQAPAAAPVEPVLIGLVPEAVGDRWDVLINLGAEVPEYFSRYQRVAEVVDGDAGRREQSRERYRFYRDRGYDLRTHQL